VRERRSLDILPVKKEAKLSASEMPGEVVGSGEEDLRCRSLVSISCSLARNAPLRSFAVFSHTALRYVVIPVLQLC